MEGFKHCMTLRGLVRYFLCGSVVLALSACSLFYVTHWDGCSEWTFRVHVYDQHTMSPIPNAVVSVIVKNETPWGEVESFVQEKESNKCLTNAEGVCNITTIFNTYGNKSIFKSEAYINFRHRNLLVQAEGYRSLDVPLKTFIKTPLELPPEENHKGLSDIQASMNKIPEPDSNLGK